MDMNEFDNLVERFGEDQLVCGNCLNWCRVEYNGLKNIHGVCLADCFQLDTSGTNVILLSHFSTCWSGDAVKQDFRPKPELLAQEKAERAYQDTLRSLDAELRREAAAW